jgi:hypothetical protein
MPDGQDKPGAISLATMERLSALDSGDAVKMHLDAKQRRLAAEDMQTRGDQVGPRYELAEAERLEQEAELILMPTTGPLTIGNGGELAAESMRPFTDTVRERPDMLTIDASRQRMELADRANVLQLGLDAAQTIQATNSLEKMLAHQMAAAHTAAMELQAAALDLMHRFKGTGCVHQHLSVEAVRMMNASARMMDTYQHGLLTIAKVRSGGQQTVVVQHVNVGDGGRAVVAGQVKSRSKKRTAKVEGQTQK